MESYEVRPFQRATVPSEQPFLLCCVYRAATNSCTNFLPSRIPMCSRVATAASSTTAITISIFFHYTFTKLRIITVSMPQPTPKQDNLITFNVPLR